MALASLRRPRLWAQVIQRSKTTFDNTHDSPFESFIREESRHLFRPETFVWMIDDYLSSIS